MKATITLTVDVAASDISGLWGVTSNESRVVFGPTVSAMLQEKYPLKEGERCKVEITVTPVQEAPSPEVSSTERCF